MNAPIAMPAPNPRVGLRRDDGHARAGFEQAGDLFDRDATRADDEARPIDEIEKDGVIGARALHVPCILEGRSTPSGSALRVR
jgi:hypothetical protein